MKSKAGNGKTGKLPPLLPKSTAAAQYHEQVFLPKLTDRFEQMSRLPLTIFVCGPSDNEDLLTKKKVDTVNELRGLGHNALIGEEIVKELKEKDTVNGRPIRPDNIYEIEVARTSDLVVIFRASPGSIAEFHEFQAISEIASKTIVYADKAHQSGYSSKGALAMQDKVYGKVEYYSSPNDIIECRLKSSVIDAVQYYQAAKWLKEQGL